MALQQLCRRARHRKTAISSVTPEILEPGRRQLGVAHSMLDVLVPEVGLQRAGVVTIVRELEPAGVA
jgi:hypothetical protein